MENVEELYERALVVLKDKPLKLNRLHSIGSVKRAVLSKEEGMEFVTLISDADAVTVRLS